MKTILAILALVASTAAFAGNNSNSNNSDTSSSNTTVTANPTATASHNGNTTASSNSNVIGSGNSAAQGGDAKSYATVGDITAKGGLAVSEGSKAGASASSGGNNLTVNEAKQRLQAPGVGLSTGSPSANCAMTGGMFLSVPGGAGGFNSSKETEGCERREWFRMLSEKGFTEQAIRIACADPIVSKANPRDCDSVKQNPSPSAVERKPAAGAPAAKAARS